MEIPNYKITIESQQDLPITPIKESFPVDCKVGLRGMPLKKFKSKYKCVGRFIKSHRIKTYNFKKKKYEIKTFWGFGIGGCCACDTFNNYDKLYLVDKYIIHESCAIRIMNGE